MLIPKCYYVFNDTIQLYPQSYGILYLSYKLFNASGGSEHNNIYCYDGVMAFNPILSQSVIIYNDSNTNYPFLWQERSYRFIEILEETDISEDFYNWMLENGTFIDTSMYIKSGEYNFYNQGSYSTYTANAFTQTVNFIVGNGIDCYEIYVNGGFTVRYKTSASEASYVYPYNTGTYNANYYLLTFNEDSLVTKECAIWFIYMCIYNGIATNPSDVVYKQTTPTGYTITFESNGGSYISPQTNVTIIEELPTPTRQGYYFNDWYYDSLFINRAKLGDTLNSNVTLYASWTLITYSVDYVTNPLIASAPQSISGVTKLPTPLPTPTILEFQYSFIDWYYDSQYLTQAFAGDTLNSNVTLYGKFEIKTYNVDFVTNGGTAVSSITGVSNLPNPLPTTTRDGYVFDGWYYDDEYSRQAYAMDVLNSNVTLYAKWEVEVIGDFVMNIYKFSGEEIMVDKRNYMLLVGSLRGTMRDEINIVSPTFTMSSDIFPNFNYVYIPNFKRYYYVANINCVRYNFYEITLTLDVLMSYREGILSLNGFIDRNENEYNDNIIDNQRVIVQGNNIFSTTLKVSGFNTNAIVGMVGTDLGGKPK